MFHPAPTHGETAWFVHDRFGMFIHWGLYALPARHEWVMSGEKIAPDEYSLYFEMFDPDLFDPKSWARAAREAGMKYFVITTKHHEGFCLWDTAFTDYKITNTPFGRDALREIVEAFRAEGLRVGFYYSLIDWHHPDFIIDQYHPLRDSKEIIEDVETLKNSVPSERVQKLNAPRDMTRYAQYMRDQVRELLTDFGKIEVLWFDFSYTGKTREVWESDKMVEMIRALQPHLILNNRLGLWDKSDAFEVDVATPEQSQPDAWARVYDEPVVWEACQTLSGSWGYHRDETTWKSPEQLIQMLVSTVAFGGNLLMNVGPTARGHFDDRAIHALKVYSAWMRLHQRSIYGCTQSEYDAPHGCRLTQNGQRLYLHFFAWPFKEVKLKGLGGKVRYAQLLNDASEIRFAGNHAEHGDVSTKNSDEQTLTLTLPIVKPDVIVPVIELFLK